jgi:hypothetical protein
MRLRYNGVVASLMLMYSFPGLVIAWNVPLLVEIVTPFDTTHLLIASLFQTVLFYCLLPRLTLFESSITEKQKHRNTFAVLVIKIAFVMLGTFVILVQAEALLSYAGASDRSSLYRAYSELSHLYPLEKIKTFLAVISLYLVLTGRAFLGLSFCLTISLFDYGFGNRSFTFYTLIIVIFAYFPNIKSRTVLRGSKLIISVLVTILLLRTYIFSGGNEIVGIDHVFAVLGEFIFTSTAPLFVHELGVSGSFSSMFSQLFGVDKLFANRELWVGAVIQDSLDIPIGLACGPLCETYFFSSDAVEFFFATFIVSITYVAFIWTAIRLVPKRNRMPVVIVQFLLMRDIIRTGLVISFSTLVLWTMVAVVLNLIFLPRSGSLQNEPNQTT